MTEPIKTGDEVHSGDVVGSYLKPTKQVSTTTVAVAFLVAILGGGAAISYFSHKPKAEVVQPCVAGPNEKCPPDDWMKSYVEFQAEQDKLKADMKDKGITERQRMLAGWAQDLAKGIPTQEGYSFDEKTKRFIKPAMPPTPPPQPEKK